MAALSTNGQNIDLDALTYDYSLTSPSLVTPGRTSLLFITSGNNTTILAGEYTEQLIAMIRLGNVPPPGTNYDVLSQVYAHRTGPILLPAGDYLIRVMIVFSLAQFEQYCLTSINGASRRICRITRSIQEERDHVIEQQTIAATTIAIIVIVVICATVMLCANALESWDKLNRYHR
jgi:hypothetical protein